MSSTPTGLLYGTPTCPPFQCFGIENALQLFPLSQVVFVNIIIVLVLLIKACRQSRTQFRLLCNITVVYLTFEVLGGRTQFPRAYA